MHLIRLQDVNQSETTLTRAVIQVAQMLGIYNAELARILHLQCADIGELVNANTTLHTQTSAWQQAEKLLQLYEKLYVYCNGDEACMHNWLRKQHSQLNKAPLYTMVDDLQIDQVVVLLNTRVKE